MNHVARIQQNFERYRRNRAWYGPTIGQLVDKVSAEKAGAAVPGGHSIWQILLHATLWREIVRKALDGEPYTMPSEEQNWSVPEDQSEAAWERARADFHRSNDAFAMLISMLNEDKLDALVADQKFTVSEAIHGIFEHDAYHAGQIAILIASSDARMPGTS